MQILPPQKAVIKYLILANDMHSEAFIGIVY